MKKLITLLSGIFLTGCSVMGIRTSKEPDFRIVADHGAVQIRYYPELLVAETLVNADYGEAGRIGFNRLANFIFGGNVQQQSMAMTTPVYRDAVGENIAMTAPVLQEAKNERWSMQFVMPSQYTLETLPTPLDETVKIKIVPARKVAVLTYSGSLNAERITEKSAELSDWLVSHALRPLSSARSAAYDPPWTLPALRRNEIHIDIE